MKHVGTLGFIPLSRAPFIHSKRSLCMLLVNKAMTSQVTTIVLGLSLGQS